MMPTAGTLRAGIGKERDMLYISTRGENRGLSFSDVTLAGLAPDAGLYVPQVIPQVSRAELAKMRTMSYPQLFTHIVSKFAERDELTPLDIATLANEAYIGDAWESREVTPVVRLAEDLYLLELFRGPTLSFKDCAMQFLGPTMHRILERRGKSLTVVGATSGDSGSAAEHALKGRSGIDVFMLFPSEGMSNFQRRQMTTLKDENIHNVAIRGPFDACQRIVKSMKYGAINSINWTRIVSQIVYYFKAYFAATRWSDQEVIFSVPTGNFGDIFAGYMARRMGLPIRYLVLATNENDVLAEFFRTGVYRRRKDIEVAKTSSPSMDIQEASNFERLVFEMVGRDPKAVVQLWREFNTNGFFVFNDWSSIKNTGIIADSCATNERHAMIKHVNSKYDVIIDPHTANAMHAGWQHRHKGVPMIVLATASPAKFDETILQVLKGYPERPERFIGIEDLPERVVTLDADNVKVKEYIEQTMARKAA